MLYIKLCENIYDQDRDRPNPHLKAHRGLGRMISTFEAHREL